MLIAYRGEYGPHHAILQTRTNNTYSFSTEETVRTYALSPNNQHDHVEAPRIIKAALHIQKPIFHNPSEPWIDFSYLIDLFGFPTALSIALRHSEDIEYTGLWQEGSYDEYCSAAGLLKEQPEQLPSLCMLLHSLLDDPEAIALFRKYNYDGAIYGGYGENSGCPEYRVFSKEQVDMISVQWL